MHAELLYIESISDPWFHQLRIIKTRITLKGGCLEAGINREGKTVGAK